MKHWNKIICVTVTSQLSQSALLLPPSGHQTALVTYTTEVAKLLWRNSTCTPLLTGYDSLFCSPSALPLPSSSSSLAPSFPLLPPHHDSIHNVILVVFQCTDGLGSWHIGLSHHQLNVPLLETSLIHLMYRNNEKDRERYEVYNRIK